MSRGRPAQTELNDRQKAFVLSYVVLGNAAEAAKEAGYNEGVARTTGPRLLRNAMVRAAIDAEYANRSQEVGITVDGVLKDLKDLAQEAKKCKQLSAAIRATELIGKHLGMFVDRVEHVDQADPKQMYQELVKAYGQTRAREQMKMLGMSFAEEATPKRLREAEKAVQGHC